MIEVAPELVLISKELRNIRVSNDKLSKRQKPGNNGLCHGGIMTQEKLSKLLHRRMRRHR